ncbi:ZIM-transcription factor 28, partial [Zea mays]
RKSTRELVGGLSVSVINRYAEEAAERCPCSAGELRPAGEVKWTGRGRRREREREKKGRRGGHGWTRAGEGQDHHRLRRYVQPAEPVSQGEEGRPAGPRRPRHGAGAGSWGFPAADHHELAVRARRGQGHRRGARRPWPTHRRESKGGSWGGGAAADHLLRRESGRLRQVPLRQGQGPAADREPAGGRRRGGRCRCRCRCPYAEPA